MKNTLIYQLSIAIFITLIFGSIRIVIYLSNPDLSEEFGINKVDIGLRLGFIFLITFLMISQSLKGLDEKHINKSLSRYFFYNILIAFLLGSILLLALKLGKGEAFEWRRELFVTVFSLVLVLGVIQLLVAYTYSSRNEFRLFLDKQTIEYEKTRMELDALKAQLNPHFLFNALNTLNGLIRIAPEEALKFNDHLSDVLRYIVQNRNTQLTSLKEELAFADQYVNLFMKRYGSNLTYEVKISDKMINTQLPVLTFQVLIENAVKHNEISNQKPLKIEVFIVEKYLSIKNNLNPKRETITSMQNGLANLNRRCELLLYQPIEIKENKEAFEVMVPLK